MQDWIPFRPLLSTASLPPVIILITDSIISSSHRVAQGSRIPILGEVAWLNTPGNKTTGYHLYQDIEWGYSYRRLTLEMCAIGHIYNYTDYRKTTSFSGDFRQYPTKPTLTNAVEAVPTEFTFGKWIEAVQAIFQSR
jgi:hypothetical protein